MPITTSASATVHQSFNDNGICVVVDATAQVNAHGAVMAYGWAVAWTVTLADGSIVNGPAKADNHDTRRAIQEQVYVTALRLNPGDSISAGASINNDDVVFDGDSASQGWTCSLKGDLVEDALRNVQNL